MFSGKFQQKSGFEKIRALLVLWEQIVELPAKPKGSRWVIRMTGAGTPQLIERLTGDSKNK